ncbi:hypothetical protein V6N12_024825 [Hibiscus sabdariffa]|uniref:F-box protein n=1 Tax=Hibiscus sabdariffa TaxID=183260 RepID=A0ABR2B9H3_9ROSI
MSDYMPVEVIIEILKRLPAKPVVRFSVFGSCNGLICVQLFSFVVDFLLWSPSIQKYIPLPKFRISEAAVFLNVGFGFDSRTNDYKAVHWLGNGKRNGGGYSHAILGFELSAEEFFEINLPENLIDLCHVDLTVMKYGESSIVVSTYQA